MNDLWILAISFLVAGSCALLGCFMVLRKMSMMSDAVSHAVLPGIVVVAIFSGLNYFNMLLSAIVFGLLASLLIQWMINKVKMNSDASLGIIYTLFFAVGIVLISAYQDEIIISSEHVLQGNIEFAPLDILIVFEKYSLGPKAFISNAIAFILVLIFIVFSYKALKITTFDSAFAASIGINTARWNALLLALTTLVTVVAFDSVGAILVIGFMVIPALSAHLWVNRLKSMIFLALAFAFLSCLSGLQIANMFNISISGSICVSMGAILLISFIIRQIKMRSFVLKWEPENLNKER